MNSAQQILALLQSHANGDEAHFYSVALEIAANHEDDAAAQELQELIDKVKVRNAQAEASDMGPSAISLPKELQDVVEIRYSNAALNSMALALDIREKFCRLIAEYLDRDTLQAHGLSPRRKILLYGPPSSGKSQTGMAFAGELKLPLFIIPIGKLMARSGSDAAARLAMLFEQMKKVQGVYFFDDFHSIAGKDAHSTDNLRQIAQLLLRLIETDHSDSILIAATTRADTLDRNWLHSFDDVVECALPSGREAVDIIKSRLTPFDMQDISWQKIEKGVYDLSYSELIRLSDDAAKSIILRQSKQALQDDLEKALRRIRDKRRL